MKQIFINNIATTLFIEDYISSRKFLDYVMKRMIEEDNIFQLERPNDCSLKLIPGGNYDSIKIFSNVEETIISFNDVIPLNI